MKHFLRTFMVLVGVVCFFNASAQQTDRLSAKITVNYQNEPLERILQNLRQEYNLNIAYSNSAAFLKKRISLFGKNRTLKEVLDEISSKTNLEYKVIGNQIILKEHKATSETDPGMPIQIVYQSIRGKVVDKEAKFPLAQVNLKLSSLLPSRVVTTDSDGNFRFDKVPVGRHVIEITYVGYQTNIIPALLVSSGKEVVLNIELSAVFTDLDAVVVTDKKDRQKPLNPMASVSARSFTVEETSRYAASFLDPARMAQSFAGVTAGNDLNNDIIIRGNSPKGLQWRLEGVEIINPNHFGEEGSSAGGISMISSSMLSNSDFFTGAFPAEYGNALSGIFDLQFRKGNSEKREYAFMAGLLGTEASVEGPFKKGSQASYLINYRYSTLGILQKLGVSPFGDRIPIYQDLAFNFNFPTKRAGTFSLFGLGGISTQDQTAERNSSVWENFDDKFDRSYGYKSGSSGIKHFMLLNDRVYLKNIVSFSGSKITDNADTLDNSYQANVFGRDQYNNSALRYSGMLNYKADNKNVYRSGLILSKLMFDLSSLAYKKDINRLSSVLNANGSAMNLEAYTQIKHDFSTRVSAVAGIHGSYFDLSKSWSIEPRAGLNWKISSDQQISAGAGVHSRLEPMAFYFATKEKSDGSVISSNKTLSPTKALHLVLGYERTFSNQVKFKAETYYQHLFKVPVSSDPAINFSALNASDAYYIYSRNYRYLVNKGVGKNLGLELTLERSLDKGYYFLLTSSLFQSKFKTIDHREFSTSYNSNYVGNIVAGKEWKVGSNNKNLFGINTKLITTGGRRYTPIDLAASIQADDQIVEESKVNGLTTSPYLRLDFSVCYRVNRSKITHSFFADVQNVLNRSNELARFYNGQKKAIEQISHAGLVPTFNYRIEF